MIRHCRGCGKYFEYTSEFFYVQKWRNSGLSPLCRGCTKQRKNARRKNNPLSRDKEVARSKEYFRTLRTETIQHYGPTCRCCGEAKDEFLVIDHIDGGGKQHRKTIGHGGRFYKWLRDNGWPYGYQVLCHNCNSSLGLYGYCPHRPEIRRTIKAGRPSLSRAE